MRLGRMAATAMGLRSLSRLRGRVGVGVLPRFTLFVWRELPPPASHHSMRCDLPRKRERCSKCADRPIQPKIIPALAQAGVDLVQRGGARAQRVLAKLVELRI